MRKLYIARKVLQKLMLPIIMILLVIVTISAVGHKRSAVSNGVVIELNNPLEQSLMTEANLYELITDYEPMLIQGGNLENINIEMIEYFLLEDESIENAQVYLDNGKKLHIVVTQKEPIVRVQPTNGEPYYLDTKGDRIPLSDNVAVRVPVITGEIDPHFEDFMDYEIHNLKGVFSLAKTLQEDPFFYAFIEQMHLNKNGEITMVPKLGDHVIEFGAVDKVERKLRNMKAFYKEVINKKGWHKYESINLSYKGQIVCTKKKKQE